MLWLLVCCIEVIKQVSKRDKLHKLVTNFWCHLQMTRYSSVITKKTVLFWSSFIHVIYNCWVIWCIVVVMHIIALIVYYFVFLANSLFIYFFLNRYYWQEWTEDIFWNQLLTDLFYLLWKFHYTGKQLKAKR